MTPNALCCRRSNGSAVRAQTDKRTDRRYQVHYLPRFAVDNCCMIWTWWRHLTDWYATKGCFDEPSIMWKRPGVDSPSIVVWSLPVFSLERLSYTSKQHWITDRLDTHADWTDFISLTSNTGQNEFHVMVLRMYCIDTGSIAFMFNRDGSCGSTFHSIDTKRVIVLFPGYPPSPYRSPYWICTEHSTCPWNKRPKRGGWANTHWKALSLFAWYIFVLYLYWLII